MGLAWGLVRDRVGERGEDQEGQGSKRERQHIADRRDNKRQGEQARRREKMALARGEDEEHSEDKRYSPNSALTLTVMASHPQS